MNNPPFAVHRSRLDGQRSQVIDLQFNSSIACFRGQHGLYSTAERRVQQGRRHPAMYSSKRIIMIFCWLESKNDTPLAYFSHPHTYENCNGGCRKLSRLHGFEKCLTTDRLSYENCFCRIFPTNGASTTGLEIGHGVFLSIIRP